MLSDFVFYCRRESSVSVFSNMVESIELCGLEGKIPGSLLFLAHVIMFLEGIRRVGSCWGLQLFLLRYLVCLGLDFTFIISHIYMPS